MDTANYWQYVPYLCWANGLSSLRSGFLKGHFSPTPKAPEGVFGVKREPALIESDAFAIAELRIRILVIRLMSYVLLTYDYGGVDRCLHPCCPPWHAKTRNRKAPMWPPADEPTVG